MAKGDATRTRLENIENELQSTTTCSAATVAELQRLLSGELAQSEKENIHSKSARAPAARCTARSRPATATATRVEDVASPSPSLSARERYILATQTVNVTLKSLSDALKSPLAQRTAQPPPKSKPSPDVATNAQKPQRSGLVHSKSSSISHYPLKERSVGQITNSPTKPKPLRRSSSYSTFTGHHPGLVATAECARVAFAYLSTPEALKFTGKDAPELALENGRLALVGKLVTHGLDSLAVREMRLLKRSLEKYLGRQSGTDDARTAPSRAASRQPAPMEKESLASLLDYGDVDFNSTAIPIIINLQIYVLRLIARVKRPHLVDEVWKYLKMSHPSSPPNLVLHMAREKEYGPKAARQLESLAQTILHVCPNISSSADDEQLQPSPDIVLCLQHLAFGIRQRWWTLAHHQGDESKELIEPFGKCLVAFARRSTLPALKKYKLAESLYSNLLGAGENTDFSRRDGNGPSGLRNSTLASLARTANLPDEALRWLGTSSSTTTESPVAATIQSVRIAAISLEGCLKSNLPINLDASVEAALDALSGSLNGAVKDLETLFIEVHALRRVATKLLSSMFTKEDSNSFLVPQQQCVRIVVASIRFSRRFIGSQPPSDAPQKSKISYQAHVAIAARVVWGVTESVSACCRFPVTLEDTWKELDALIQDSAQFLSQVEEGAVEGGHTNTEPAQSPFVRFSNLHWNLRRQLQKPGFEPVSALNAMQRSTALLESRPPAEQYAGQLGYKFERLAEELANHGQITNSRLAFKQCIQILLDDGLVSAIVEATSKHHVRQVLEGGHSLGNIGRLLRCYGRSFAKHGLTQPDELAFFDDNNHADVVRGALLEWQLGTYQQILSKHRSWEPALNVSIQVMVERLLSIYQLSRFPIRRQRLHLLLLQLSHIHPDAISKAYIQANFQRESTVDVDETADRNLSRFGDHLKALLTLKALLQQGDVTNEAFRNCFNTWQRMLDSAKSWEDLVERIDNPDHWLEAVRASVDLLCAKGEEYQALPVLHVLIRILELQKSSDPSPLIMALCTLGLQFLRLGYSGKAGLTFAKGEVLLSNEHASTEAKLRWHLGYAEYILAIGNVVKCQNTLYTAESLARNDTSFMDLSKSSTPLSGRMTFYSIVANACYISSLLSSAIGAHNNAAKYARQAITLNRRIWAALEANAKARKAAMSTCSSSVTEGSSPKAFDHLNSMRDDKGIPVASSITHEALKAPEFWSLIPSLYRALIQNSAVTASQGLLEEAVFVLQQAEKVASAIGSHTLLVDNASRLAELWILSGRPDKAQPLLDNLDASSRPEHLGVVSYHLSRARMHHASHNYEDEIVEYDIVEELLHRLSSPSHFAFLESFTSDLDSLANNVSALTLHEPKPEVAKQPRSGRCRTTAAKATSKSIGKTTRTTRKAPLQTAPTPASVQPKAAISPVSKNPSIGDHCAFLDAYRAEIAYRKVSTYLFQGNVVKAIDILSKVGPLTQHRDGSHAWVHFKAMLAHALRSIAEDFTLNSLPESTIAFPSIPPKDRQSSEGVAGKRPNTKSLTKNTRNKQRTGDTFVQLIQTARERLVEAHAEYATAASNHVFRQLSAALSQATVLLSAVSQGQIRGSIHPLYSAYMSELPKNHALALAQGSIEVDHEPMSREVYLQWPKPTMDRPSLVSPTDFQHGYIDIIPDSWTAISLALSDEQDEIYITRFERGNSPFVLRLPLGRHSSRDLDEEEFTFTDGKREFEEIIELSDFTTRNAKDLTSREGRKQWWEDRQALDDKLRELLLNIENIWIGGFKGIFSDHVRQPALLARFRKSFDNILNRHLPSRQKKGLQKKPTLDPRVLELFIGLGDASNAKLDLDEALTDLIYFVVDILQFNGEPNAYDEIDFEAMVIETHDALRAYHDNAQEASNSSHTILILDKNLHMLPWESLPCLEKLSISRLPSLAALRERLLAARAPTAISDAPAGHYISASAGGTSMLNPSGDLSHTSKTIKPHLDTMQGPWTHIANRAPSEHEFEQCLKNDQLLLYFGHGSGAQYIRSKVVRRLYLESKANAEAGENKSGCATAFLFGCSSVHLSENGIYEPSGMLSSYLSAGAPAVLGMLWDVTDKDCDRLAVRAGELWGLWPEVEAEGSVEPPPTVRKKKGKGRVAQLADEVETPRAGSRSRKGKGDDAGDTVSEEGVGRRRRGVGLDEAIREARKACVLRYLNGAAAVVYGIPVYLE
ncbi:hypothetical protein BU23DRAFT_505166 [Bimuria novae-zelandiae CBS 107.79]|uniref:separase n=1 Tax=Bimuria novae-zelandiae CBS 107.79 TaxID=1447943 RepID=A0A6A5VGU0_9PLEO|nr:hypothetical protein BU23DRAFT_505166 [Bimuria novae-zelandiae CBS 107.79]